MIDDAALASGEFFRWTKILSGSTHIGFCIGSTMQCAKMLTLSEGHKMKPFIHEGSDESSVVVCVSRARNDSNIGYVVESDKLAVPVPLCSFTAPVAFGARELQAAFHRSLNETLQADGVDEAWVDGPLISSVLRAFLKSVQSIDCAGFAMFDPFTRSLSFLSISDGFVLSVVKTIPVDQFGVPVAAQLAAVEVQS